MLWWLSPSEGWDAVTLCGLGKLLTGHNYLKLRRWCEVYGLRGACILDECVCVFYLT